MSTSIAEPAAAAATAPPSASGRPPGPRGLPFIGVAPAIARDPYRSFQRIAREYGDVASVPVPGMDLVLVSHPDHVKHVMNTRHADYPKPPLFRDVLWREAPRFHGMANGEDWRSVRKMLQPKFTAKGLTPLAELMFDTITETIDGWATHAESGERVDMQEAFSTLTMSVMLRSMFTVRPTAHDTERLSTAFQHVMRGMAVGMLTTPLPGFVPRPYGRATDAALRTIHDYTDAMVAERRRNPIEDGDLLSMVLDARFEDGSPMSDEHIRRELLGLIFGGYETTAAVMAWVLARLPFSPEAQERAYAEVDTLLGGRQVTLEDVDRLEWLRACFDEAQRLQGFSVNAREASVDDEIGGYAIPAGTTVAFSGWTLHRDPRWWRDPERFDPSRFIEDDINQYAFLPFGVGPRRCLGMRMGYMVGMATLATAFQCYRFELPPGWQPKPKFSFSSIVNGGVPVTIRRREEVTA